MFEKIPHAEWTRNLALMAAGLTWDDARGEWVTSFWTRQEVRQAVASCLTCGAKYRPAGGGCTHEQLTDLWRQAEAEKCRPSLAAQVDRIGSEAEGYMYFCGQCQDEWRPGHTCIRQPTPEQARELAETAYWLRVVDGVLNDFGYATQSAAPELYEGI